MDETNIKLAIIVIPAIVGATVAIINLTNKLVAKRIEVEKARVKEASVGQSKVEELITMFEEAKSERYAIRDHTLEVRKDFSELKEDFYRFKQEIRDMTEAISQRRMQQIDETIKEIKKTKRRKMKYALIIICSVLLLTSCNNDIGDFGDNVKVENLGADGLPVDTTQIKKPVKLSLR